ncbi:hypothetical protein V7S43_016846 [Phytophthora oleae]|uniref:Uncharacterized protein n=1 Tax=Phytophthora oleae TaxID=2107226 RepID=A0ABD3EVJ9_9STRA
MRRSVDKLYRLKFKPERFMRLGRTVVFESEALQRQSQDKRQQLLQEAAADQTASNALIAKKVLKYRNLYN